MRLAHISDLHVLSLRGVHPLAFANKRLVGGLNLLTGRAREYSLDVCRALISDLNEQDVDHVVVTGDISNLSLAAEFELAREILMGLSLPASEVTVIPGNHDSYTLEAHVRDDFSRVLAPYLRGDMAGEAGDYPFVRIREHVAIVALSTAHPSPPLLAIGTLGERQLRATETLLSHPEVQRRFRVVLLHHPPRSAETGWHNRLTDGDAFVAMIRRVGADLVLHGHLHRECRDHLPGPRHMVPVIGINSSTWVPRDRARHASYNIYQLPEPGADACDAASWPLQIQRRGWHKRRGSFIDIRARAGRSIRWSP